jgi:hypothetical protein
LSLLLLPGSIPATFLTKTTGLGAPLAILAGNAFFYSLVAFAIVSGRFRNATRTFARLTAVKLLVPTVVLLFLACVPALNPLWPRGLTELTNQEKDLQQALPPGLLLDQARSVLSSNGMHVNETQETTKRTILQRDNKGVTASPGDRVLSARLETKASEFPCGYVIEVVLLFGPDERLKEPYIHRLRLCP